MRTQNEIKQNCVKNEFWSDFVSKSNKRAKDMLIKLYGAECFIEKLHIRPSTERKYSGKAQYYKMKQLTYHHIIEKSKNGKATVENGALLSLENHQWFNKQSREEQNRINNMFQEYKSQSNQKYKIAVAQITNGKIEKTELLVPEDREEPVYIQAYDITEEEWQNFKAKRNKRVLENPKWENAKRKFKEIER